MPNIKPVVWAFCFTFLAPLSNAGKPHSLIKSGIESFKKKDFYSAYNLFKEALDNGYKSEKLLYNLGVTSFQLGQAKQAIHYFEKLDRTSFSAISHYNIGLCWESLDNRKDAKKAYLAAVNGNNSKVRKMARSAIKRLDSRQEKSEYHRNASSPQSTLPFNGVALLSISKATDSNITLSQSESLTNQNDTYTQAFMLGSLDLPMAFSIVTSVLDLKYDDNPSFDFNLISLGIEKYISINTLSLTSFFSYEELTLGGNDYLSTTIGKITATKNVLDLPTSVSFEYASIEADALVNKGNEGERYQFRFELKPRFTESELRMRLQIESNHRENNDLTDYSPNRYSAGIKYRYRWSSSLSTDVETSYRLSRYREIADLERSDRKLWLTASSRYKINRHISLDVQAFFSKQKSTESDYTYERNGILIGATLFL